MKIISLWLKNFRQFYGEQQIHFATGENGRNITVIHGYNGSGKTALLNAFVWCLYGKTTPDLEESDRIHNERAVAEIAVGGNLDAAVRLEYEVHDATYIVQRTRTLHKTGDMDVRLKEPELFMWKRGPDGTIQEEGRHATERQLRINQLLPQGLYPFFFFNGERVERLASAAAYDDVEKGVKTLLDVEVFERGAYRLRNLVVPDLARELKAFGDTEISAALEEQEKADQDRKTSQDKIDTTRESIKKLSEEIELLEKKQSTIAALANLTDKRTSLREELTRIDKEEANLNSDLARELSLNGYLVFAEPVFKKTEELVNAARQRGEIPAKIKPQFVDDLLGSGECICGRPLHSGSTEWHKLVEWRQSTGLAALEEAISQTSASIAPLRQRCEHYHSEIDRIQARRNELLVERKNKRDDLSIIDQQIGDRSQGEDAAELATLIAKRKQEQNNHQLQLLLTEREVAAIDENRAELRDKIKQLQAQDTRAALVKRQKEAAERVADALEAILQVQKESVRASLDNQIAAIWRDAAIKDYRASIGDDYRLALTKRVAGIEQPVYGASTGERQVLALSFVASLVRAAAQNIQEQGKSKMLGIQLGGHYPLVMDSPFGSLEDDYRAKVAEWVPKLAHQVVVLVSKTQWRNEVETAMRSRIGREYILELQSAKPHADRTIDIGGRKYPYVVSTLDLFEQTKIEEVD